MVEVTGYWTFFCNPAKWEIDLFLATNTEYDKYQVNEWYKDTIKPGQLGIIRVGIDNRLKEQLQGRQKLNFGIYAIVEVLDTPKKSMDDSNFYLNEEDKAQEKFRVKIRYIKNLLDDPLLITTLKQNSIINKDQYLIEGFQRATMPLKKKAFDEIIDLIGSNDQIFSNIELEKVDTIEEITEVELKYRNASPEVKEVISKRIERGKISSIIKKLNDYECKVCEALGENPHSFKKIDREYYIETHHIIPVANLIKGSLAISNLITVCANHHRQFHYGDITIIDSSNDQLSINIEGQILCIKKTIFRS